MIDAALAEFSIDLASSWMVGDKKSDVETGRTIGSRSALVLTGYGLQDQSRLDHQPDAVLSDLGQAAEHIVSA